MNTADRQAIGQAQIRALIDLCVQAIRAKDINGAKASVAPDVLSFDVSVKGRHNTMLRRGATLISAVEINMAGSALASTSSMPALRRSRQIGQYELLRKDYDWSKEVAAKRAPTLIAVGDGDAVHTPHAVEFFGLLEAVRRTPAGTSRGSPTPSALF